MEIITEKGCGLDVHKETVVVCIIVTEIKKESSGMSMFPWYCVEVDNYWMQEWITLFVTGCQRSEAQLAIRF